MPDKILPGPVQENACIREAVCIHTKKIYDSCKDKDCIEDLRVYLTQPSQAAADHALSVRAGKAELLYVSTDVEPVSFNRGFYTVDVRYYYRITADAFIGAARPVDLTGLAVFDKRIVLFGSEGNVKTFSSEAVFQGNDEQSIRTGNLPTAVVEAVDPLVLNTKLVDLCDCHNSCSCELAEIPSCICSCFGNDLCFSGDSKRLFVTLGQFSIVRLERDSQLLIPVYDYCMPEKECACGGSVDDPCEIFRHVKFPVDEFFPPNSISDCNDDYQAVKSLGCYGGK